MDGGPAAANRARIRLHEFFQGPMGFGSPDDAEVWDRVQHGAQGVGQALLEQCHYNDSGQLLTGSFMDYAMPRAGDLPAIVSETLESPTALNPLGVKGVGETGVLPMAAAIASAIEDALQTFGVKIDAAPISPQELLAKIWAGKRAKVA